MPPNSVSRIGLPVVSGRPSRDARAASIQTDSSPYRSDGCYVGVGAETVIAVPARACGGAAGPLRRREWGVAPLLARGLANKQIAAKLVIAEGTAAIHVGKILGKLGVGTRARVTAWAVEHGLTRPHEP